MIGSVWLFLGSSCWGGKGRTSDDRLSSSRNPPSSAGMYFIIPDLAAISSAV